jgi:HlyD family secretion protein
MSGDPQVQEETGKLPGEPCEEVPKQTKDATGDATGDAVVTVLPVLPVRSRRPSSLVAFQPDALEVEERPPPTTARATLYAVVALLTAATIWASVAEVEQVVSAEGKMTTRAPNLVIQPLEISLVRSIDVKPGMVVTAGTRLAVLDPTVSSADVDQLRTRKAALTARVERLAAELGDSEYAPPVDTAEQALESAILQQRRSLRQAQIERHDQEIAHLKATLTTNATDLRSLSERLVILNEVENMRAQLVASQTGSRLNLLEARSMRLEVQGEMNHLREEEAGLVHKVEAHKAEREAFIREFNRAALEELAETRTELGRITEELVKAEFRKNQVELTAPTDAIVLDVAQRSSGSVLQEAEPLITLVPLNEPIEAEVRVNAADVARVAVGQTVRVKFDALPFQKHGTAYGVVKMLSGDSFGSGEGEERRPPFYRARVDLTDLRLRDVPEGFKILPGMVLQAEILAGRRTVLSYLLYPLIRGLDESAREP